MLSSRHSLIVIFVLCVPVCSLAPRCFIYFPGRMLSKSGTNIVHTAHTVQSCLATCLESVRLYGFVCRSVMFGRYTAECVLSRWDRRLRPLNFLDSANFYIDYYENICSMAKPYEPFPTVSATHRSANGRSVGTTGGPFRGNSHPKLHTSPPVDIEFEANSRERSTNQGPDFATSLDPTPASALRFVPDRESESESGPTSEDPNQGSLLVTAPVSGVGPASIPGPASGFRTKSDLASDIARQSRLVSAAADSDHRGFSATSKGGGFEGQSDAAPPRAMVPWADSFERQLSMAAVAQKFHSPITLVAVQQPSPLSDAEVTVPSSESPFPRDFSASFPREPSREQSITRKPPQLIRPGPVTRHHVPPSSTEFPSRLSPSTATRLRPSFPATPGQETEESESRHSGEIHPSPTTVSSSPRPTVAASRRPVFECFRMTPNSQLLLFKEETIQSESGRECATACVRETAFYCMSVNYDLRTKNCTLNGGNVRVNDVRLTPSTGIDYYENVCAFGADKEDFGDDLNVKTTREVRKEAENAELHAVNVTALRKCFTVRENAVLFDLNGVFVEDAKSLASCLITCGKSRRRHNSVCQSVNWFKLTSKCFIHSVRNPIERLEKSPGSDFYLNSCSESDFVVTKKMVEEEYYD